MMNAIPNHRKGDQRLVYLLTLQIGSKDGNSSCSHMTLSSITGDLAKKLPEDEDNVIAKIEQDARAVQGDVTVKLSVL